MKQKKRGSISTKIAVAAFFFLLQFAFLVFVMCELNSRSLWISYVCTFLSIILVITIVNRRGNPSYKITWLIFILAVPLFAVPVYFLWGGSFVMPRFKKRMRAEQAAAAKLLKPNEQTQRKLEYADIFHSRQSTFLRNESGFPVYTDTSVEYLSPGEVFYPRLLEELKKAEKFILIEVFILAEGEMWDGIHEILKEKVKAGVEVKILFDDFGSISRQYKHFAKNLRAEGIKVAVFNPIKPSFDIFLNNRNHRKIVVIDGKVAATGGINIGDEYINRIERFGYWMDCAAIFKGAAVKSFSIMFCEMWNSVKQQKERINPENYINDIYPRTEGFVQPYCDDPLGNNNPAEGLYMQILNSAQKYVYITSPYLILDNEMITVLCGAARAGVDVRIVAPKHPDKWYVHPVTQYYYEQLLEAGVRIYEFTPGFIHSKLFVSDDSVATVGTVNMDYRSFYFHFECGAWMCNNQAVLDIKKHILRIIEDSEEIKYDKWKKRPLALKFKQSLLHLFAPFM